MTTMCRATSPAVMVAAAWSRGGAVWARSGPAARARPRTSGIRMRGSIAEWADSGAAAAQLRLAGALRRCRRGTEPIGRLAPAVIAFTRLLPPPLHRAPLVDQRPRRGELGRGLAVAGAEGRQSGRGHRSPTAHVLAGAAGVVATAAAARLAPAQRGTPGIGVAEHEARARMC